MKNLMHGIGAPAARFVFNLEQGGDDLDVRSEEIKKELQALGDLAEKENQYAENKAQLETLNTEQGELESRLDAAKNSLSTAQVAFEEFNKNDEHFRIKKSGKRKLRNRYEADATALKNAVDAAQIGVENTNTDVVNFKRINGATIKQLEVDIAAVDKKTSLENEQATVEEEKKAAAEKIQGEKDELKKEITAEQNRIKNEKATEFNEIALENVLETSYKIEEGVYPGTLAFAIDKRAITEDAPKGLGITWATPTKMVDADGNETMVTLRESKAWGGDTMSFEKDAEGNLVIVISRPPTKETDTETETEESGKFEIPSGAGAEDDAPEIENSEKESTESGKFEIPSGAGAEDDAPEIENSEKESTESGKFEIPSGAGAEDGADTGNLENEETPKNDENSSTETGKFEIPSGTGAEQ